MSRCSTIADFKTEDLDLRKLGNSGERTWNMRIAAEYLAEYPVQLFCQK